MARIVLPVRLGGILVDESPGEKATKGEAVPEGAVAELADAPDPT